MKTPLDPRHRRRIKLMQQLFSFSFAKRKPAKSIAPIVGHFSRLDADIQAAAPEWPVEKIAKIDLAILRLATYELVIEGKTPPKVIIDEAVELAKEFGNEKSPKFVNGALGTILKTKLNGKN